MAEGEVEAEDMGAEGMTVSTGNVAKTIAALLRFFEDLSFNDRFFFQHPIRDLAASAATRAREDWGEGPSRRGGASGDAGVGSPALPRTPRTPEMKRMTVQRSVSLMVSC